MVVKSRKNITKIMDITKEIEISRRRNYDEEMVNLNQNIAAYEKMQNSLEAEHMGKWVVFHDCILIALYDSFEDAADEAVQKFGRGPFLIRQIGRKPLILSPRVIYPFEHDPRTMRL